MAWHPEPRRIRLDDSEAVVLSPDAYQRLDAIRRQAGAQANRIRALRQQLAGATATLEQIAQAVTQAECATGPDNRGRHAYVRFCWSSSPPMLT
jgi:hypothetical protein